MGERMRSASSKFSVVVKPTWDDFGLEAQVWMTSFGIFRSSFQVSLLADAAPAFAATTISMEYDMPTFSKKRKAEARHLASLFPSETDPHPNVHGVLLSDEIIFYAANHNLVSPFNPDNLKPAGYELTIGDEYYKSGAFLELSPNDDDNNTVVIPPFEVAVLKTAEILCLPRYMIARCNIRVRHAYSGLLWVGGPQVDPGYVGHLFCPIYNLSDKTVTPRVGEPIALMDFVKTTPFDVTNLNVKRYPHPPKRSFIEDYGIDGLRSALFTRAGEKLVKFRNKLKA